MKIGIGLPAAVPGASGEDLIGWARESEQAGFSTLAALDRVVYGNYEPLITLAAAAGATTRIGLITYLAIVPPRQTALFAKQAASLDRLSGGRLTLGVGIGGRGDDYVVNGVPTKDRGRRLEEQLVTCRQMWSGEAEGDLARIGPAPARSGGPELILGGATAGIERAARYGDGWMAGWPVPFDDEPLVVSGAGVAAKPLPLRGEIARLREQWAAQGRSGTPKVMSGCYFALGSATEQDARAYLESWYGFDGPLVEQAVKGPIYDPDTARRYCDAFAEAGCDEFVFIPAANKPDQIEALAKAVLT
jgi:alkanesulfonate monooxygenase SsuD/methylene tetrahydromethanopterin reductase-like flavin-dependent oxidoreductase (luciferase family)